MNDIDEAIEVARREGWKFEHGRATLEPGRYEGEPTRRKCRVVLGTTDQWVRDFWLEGEGYTYVEAVRNAIGMTK